MSEGPDRTLTTLNRLAEEISERTVRPDFEKVTARARHRRRSRLVASGVAAAVVVAAAVMVTVALDDPAGTPSPASPGQGDGPPRKVRELVQSPRSHPFEMAGGLDGSLAVVWRDLVHPAPTFALVVRDAGGTVSGRLLDQPFDLTAVPGGWVASRDGSSASFVTSDASVTDLRIESTRVAPQAGDVAVPTQSRFLLWRSETGTLVLPDLPPRTEAAVVTDDGVLVSASPDGLLSVAGDEVVASHEPLPGRVVLAGHDDDVTAVALGDAPDGSLPLERVMTTHDAGDSWLPRRGSGIEEIDSVVVTESGETLMTSLEGELVVIERDGTVRRLEEEPKRGLTLAGDRVYALDGRDSHGPLWWSDDDGRTWQQETLPGLG
jgi:hypothetical protein